MKILGVEVSCHDDDSAWLLEMVSKMPHKSLVNGVLDKYSEVHQSHDGTLKDIGRARREANIRLLRYVKRLLESQR